MTEPLFPNSLMCSNDGGMAIVGGLPEVPLGRLAACGLDSSDTDCLWSQVLLCDEPTSGLDSAAAANIVARAWDMLSIAIVPLAVCWIKGTAEGIGWLQAQLWDVRLL